MSISHPKNRIEFKKYILTKLGAPVLQINVSDEQLDIAIEDAFQFFNERQHFNGTENVYLRVKIEDTFARLFKTSSTEKVYQSEEPIIYQEGMVSNLQLVSPGSGYKYPEQNAIINQPTTFMVPKPLRKSNHKEYDPKGSKGTQDKKHLLYLQLTQGPQAPQGPQYPTKPPHSITGEGLTVDWGEERTVDGGLLSVNIHHSGKNYKIGDKVIIDGGDKYNCAVFQVTKVKHADSLHGFSIWESQRNYIIMPDDVLGVDGVVLAGGASNQLGYPGGGVIPGAFFTNPFLTGGAGSGNCGNMGFDLVTYFTLQQWLADMNFLFNNPVSYSFNQRTHRLFINSDDFAKVSTNNYMVFHCDVRPSPELYPSLWDDLFVKRYATALTKRAWASNMSKFANVSLPGGINLNGQEIYNQAQAEIQSMEERFSLDYADPVLDCVM